jgi:hypothetical protein
MKHVASSLTFVVSSLCPSTPVELSTAVANQRNTECGRPTLPLLLNSANIFSAATLRPTGLSVAHSAAFQPQLSRALSFFHRRSCYISHFDCSPVRRGVANSKYTCEELLSVWKFCEQFFGCENARKTTWQKSCPSFRPVCNQSSPPPLNTNCSTSNVIVVCKR